ncbi:MAG: ATP synthase F1 subunit delta [Bacteroidales bacterium]|nr:ATP synthase F1 subunit delta [Bacteroidales bacterium]
MNLSKISVRYAKALFQVAEQKKVLDEVSNDMEVLFNAAREVKVFHDFLDNPVLPPKEKKNAIHKIFGDKLNPLTLDFLDLVIKNNRLDFIEGMARQYKDRYKKHMGIVEAVITTVQPLDQDLKEKFIKLIKTRIDKKIQLKEISNPDILGGFILKIDDEQVDASVKTQLNNIEKELLRQSVVVE